MPTNRYKDKGLLHTPEKSGDVTPERVPLDTGHLSGGEYNQLHSTESPALKKLRERHTRKP